MVPLPEPTYPNREFHKDKNNAVQIHTSNTAALYKINQEQSEYRKLKMCQGWTSNKEAAFHTP